MNVVTNIFDTGSKQLEDFLARNRVGNKFSAPTGGKVWTITKLETDPNIPPNPTSGQASTKVTLILE